MSEIRMKLGQIGHAQTAKSTAGNDIVGHQAVRGGGTWMTGLRSKGTFSNDYVTVWLTNETFDQLKELCASMGGFDKLKATENMIASSLHKDDLVLWVTD